MKKFKDFMTNEKESSLDEIYNSDPKKIDGKVILALISDNKDRVGKPFIKNGEEVPNTIVIRADRYGVAFGASVGSSIEICEFDHISGQRFDTTIDKASLKLLNKL